MLSFHLKREVTVAGFAADANPNTTQPSAARVYEPAGSVAGQGADRLTRNLGVYFRAVDATGAEVPTATITFTVWQRDKGASANQSGSGAVRDQWVNVGTFTTVASSVLSKVAALGDTVVQVTAIAAATATKYQQWIGELTT